MLGLIVLLTLVAAIVIPLMLIARRDRRSAGVEWSGAWRETGESTAGAYANLPPDVARRRQV